MEEVGSVAFVWLMAVGGVEAFRTATPRSRSQKNLRALRPYREQRFAWRFCRRSAGEFFGSLSVTVGSVARPLWSRPVIVGLPPTCCVRFCGRCSGPLFGSGG